MRGPFGSTTSSLRRSLSPHNPNRESISGCPSVASRRLTLPNQTNPTYASPEKKLSSCSYSERRASLVEICEQPGDRLLTPASRTMCRPPPGPTRSTLGNDDYALEVFRAMEEVWDGTGMFVFTSSGSVYAENKGGVVTEESPIDDKKVDSPLRSEC